MRGCSATTGAAGVWASSVATLASYDVAAPGLSRWLRRRLLSMAEKRRGLKARLQVNAAPPHVNLVHRYEFTLREVFDAVMAETYGDDWRRQGEATEARTAVRTRLASSRVRAPSTSI